MTITNPHHSSERPSLTLTLGLFTDGPTWPEHGAIGDASLGAPVVGPNGLLGHVETLLGLTAPPTPAVERIAAWQARLEAVTTPERFWTRSLAADAWATARLLLGWRDRLIDAGWDPTAAYTLPRLRDLAAAEQVAGDLPPGRADRIAGATRVVASDGLRGVARIRLVDDRALFPSGTRRLLDALEFAGVAIEPLPHSPPADGDTALARLQRWLGAPSEPSGAPDGSFVVAHADSTLVAADTLAELLATLGEERVVVVAQGGDTHLLDAALTLAGRPRAGYSTASPHRGALQMLPLAFQSAWAPLDVQALLDLILASPGPLAGFAQVRLAGALSSAPSIRSEAWRAAWTAIEERLLADAATPTDTRAVRTRLERWRTWVEPKGADPEAGMPLTDALAICDRVATWAIARLQLTHDPLYGATATIATDARRALQRLGRDRLPRALVERVVDQALHEGDADPTATVEAGPHITLAHPGALWGPADTVVWWDLRDTGERAERAPWTRAERAELEHHGAVIDSDARSAAALVTAWERAARHARKRLVLVDTHSARPDAAPHPFTHRIASAAERLANHIDLEDALRQSTLRVGALELQRRAVVPGPAPTTRPHWPTPAGFADLVRDRAESATSLERLVECQLAWALGQVGKVRPGNARSIPDIHQLSGNLAHALSAAIFQPGTPPAPEAAERHARELLEDAIDAIAAPLRQPEYAADLTRVRRRLPQAMSALARVLADNRLTVEGTELQVAFTPSNGPAEVHGIVDLLGRDSAGNPVVVDLKWTRSRRHRDDLAEGRAVQLATYAAALHARAGDAPYAADMSPPRAGYFRLMQQEFTVLQGDGLSGMAVDGPALPSVWESVLTTWRTWTRHATGGALLATKVPGFESYWPEELPRLREPKCEYCPYFGLCWTGATA